MAARKEIRKLIEAEGTIGTWLSYSISQKVALEQGKECKLKSHISPTLQEWDSLIQDILEIYNERRADVLTLENDISELIIYFCFYTKNQLEIEKEQIKTAIIILLQTAKDWGIILSEKEISKYDAVEFSDNTSRNAKNKLSPYVSFASYLRKLYGMDKDQQKQRLKYTSIELSADPKVLPPANSISVSLPIKRGRKKAPPFTSVIKTDCNKEKVLKIIHDIIDQRTSVKDKAFEFISLATAGIIRQPDGAECSYTTIVNEFFNNKRNSSLEDYFRYYYYPDRVPYKGKKAPKFKKELIENEAERLKNLFQKGI